MMDIFDLLGWWGMKDYFELTQKDIDEFKVLYKKYYDIELSDMHAQMLARHLIAFMAFVIAE
jgi:hypothetical protein